MFAGASHDWLMVVGTGFCGGYTTFSTAMVETVRLIQAGDLRRATANAVGSVLLCLAAAALGVALMAV
jgi:CrcB protein